MELARGLQHSNIKEISDLAKGYLKLAEKFDEIQEKYLTVVTENVMIRHDALFKKLAENGD
jgi:hypothetical protein